MFRLQLFRIRAFTAGVFASFLSAVGRGGLMFMLIIWLQGIWLHLHGYDFVRTPLWAGIYMLPLTVGFLIAGPISGVLSDRYGARPFATSGMLCTATAFFLLERLPVDFGYWTFAPLLLLMGLSNGLFLSPNRAAVMNSLPAEHRGAGSGMYTTWRHRPVPKRPALSSWAGLTPTQRRESPPGHITKQGSRFVRWAVVETVARQRGATPIHRHHHQVVERRGNQAGWVAAARKPLILVVYGLRDGEIRRLAKTG